MHIELNDAEALHAIKIGGKRHWEALKKNLPDKHGFQGDGWEVHIEGAMGELAVAKALKIPWEASINTFKHPDLGPFYIRTRSQHHYDLLIRENDENNAIWILVTGKEGKYHIQGWIFGRDAKKDIWAKTYGQRPKAYFVPKEALHPTELLNPRLKAPSRWRIYGPFLQEILDTLPKSHPCYKNLTSPHIPTLYSGLHTLTNQLSQPPQEICQFLLNEIKKTAETTRTSQKTS